MAKAEACVVCGGPLGYRKKRLCGSADCRRAWDAMEARRRRGERPQSECAECGELVPQMKRGQPRRFCSDKCKQRFHNRIARRRVKPLVFEPIDCAECGKSFLPARRNARYCSRECYLIGNDKRPKFVAEERECVNCGSQFTTRRYDQRFCCKVCQSRFLARERVRRERTDSVSDYTDREVFIRDGWNCHICGSPVSQLASRTTSEGPTIDHIVPLSRGGRDVADNVALAHWRCNNEKNNRV